MSGEEIARRIVENFRRIDAACGGVKGRVYTGERMVTPNLGLVIPGWGDAGWHLDLGANFVKLDTLLGGIGLLSLLDKEDDASVED